MSHNSVHRAASAAKHKTAASLRKVLGSHGHSSSAGSFPRRGSLGSLTEDLPSESTRALNIGVTSLSANEANAHQRSSLGVLRVKDKGKASEEDTIDDDGYVTANDEALESGNSSDESQDEQRTETSMYDASTKTLGNEGYRQTGSGSSLTEEEGQSNPHSQVIKKLRIRLVDSASEERLNKVDDATLLRFLVARNMDVGRAADMFIKDMRWRDELMPLGYISEDTVPHQLEAEKVFLQGIDKRGRPLLIVIGNKHFSKGRDIEEFKRYIFYCIERTIASIPQGKDKFVTIVDLGATGFKNMDTSATLMIVDYLQAHYPERMAQLFLVHVPSMFNMSWKFIEPAIDSKTREKITIVNETDLETTLTQEIGEVCLPIAYGGQMEFLPIQRALIDNSSFPCKAIPSQ